MSEALEAVVIESPIISTCLRSVCGVSLMASTELSNEERADINEDQG